MAEADAPAPFDAPDDDMHKDVMRVSVPEHTAWLGRSGRPVTLDKKAMRKYQTAAPLIFKLRYKIDKEDSRLTRWFGTTLMTDYEMRRRDVQLELTDDAPGRSPLTTVRVAAAVAAALVLLALVGFGVLLAVRLGCPTGGVDSASAAPAAADASSSAAADARRCDELVDVKAWTNCSRACSLSDGYPTPGEGLPADNNCTRVLWKACYGLDACWPTPTDPNVPPTLECFYGDKHHEDLYDVQGKADSCAAKSSYCYAFAPYEGGKVYYGCYEGGDKTTKIVPSTKTVGCGKNIGNYSCALVAADLTVGQTPELYVGQLCCCHGSRCDVNKTLAQRAIDEMQANSTCEGASRMSDNKDDARSLDNASTGLQQCERGGLCIDYAKQEASSPEYKHSSGCRLGSSTFNQALHSHCSRRLGTADRTCFTARVSGDDYGVCCCRGSNCTADNAFDYLFPNATTASEQPDDACSLNYALHDGAPGEVGGGGGKVEHGCVTDLTRVPPPVVAAACFRYGCFATRDVDDADVSLCCCSGVDCEPADVRAFVDNRAAPPPSTPAEETSAAEEKEAETASDCGWALWAAVACLLLGLLLVAPVLAVGLYLIYQFTWANEYARWERLFDIHTPKDTWPADMDALVDQCVAAIRFDDSQD